MRLFRLVGYFLLCCFFSTITVAKDLSVTVKLVEIKSEKNQESKVDELYFHTTMYSSLGKNTEGRVPVFPMHWPSKQLSKVNNVVLWQGRLKEGESIKLMISLLEQDLPPLEADDVLGSAEIKLSNQNGQLKKEWLIPIFEEKKEVEMLKPGDPQRFLFKGAGALYTVAFRVEQK